jgi:hypothetical protein
MTANKTNQRTLEVILVLVSVALTCVLHEMTGYGIIVLNLFYLPVALAAFYLGRYRAGVLAFFSVIAASVVTSLNLGDFAGSTSPFVIGLAVIVWGAVLGLLALLVGTLSDELSSRIVELHEAYVGVVEVLSQYLQSANPRLKDRSHRIAELCQEVAQQMKLSPREVDDIRVAALLHDMENIEVTARVIRKAMGDLSDEHKGAGPGQHTFHGTELVHSLGPVLLGAFPLVLNQAETEQQHAVGSAAPAGGVPLGARIIQAVRAYDDLKHGKWALPGASNSDIIEDLRRDIEANHLPAVLQALERVVGQIHPIEKAPVPSSNGGMRKPVGAV